MGKDVGKKISRCSLVYLGVDGASPEDCCRQKKKSLTTEILPKMLTVPNSGMLLRTAHPLPLSLDTINTRALLKQPTSAVLVQALYERQ